MENKSFNLITDAWIKVIECKTDQEKTVSLMKLFENAQDYRQLAGEMRIQDLAILRLLLAILTTVYTRVDTNGNIYDWLMPDDQETFSFKVDQDEFYDEEGSQTLLATWHELYEAGHFTSAVTQYLTQHADRFDFFGERPFYQVTTDAYDALVPKSKNVAAGKGQVLVKQLNRRVSESANTPSIFAPKSGEEKNELPLDELIRWVITYQNYTGVTDKTKIITDEKFSNPAGWLYRINPVFVKGQTLFETLMLNLVLVDFRDAHDETYTLQRPVWEFPTVHAYIEMRKKQLKPDNLAELYTSWSRILHIEWHDQDTVSIFSAGIPMFETDNAWIEPMTIWRFDKKAGDYRPAVRGLRSLGIAMWRNFGQYVKVNESDPIHEPGLVLWLRQLKVRRLIARDKPLLLNSVALLSDGNATSQSPAVEIVDDMQLQADVLFDDEIAQNWPAQIENAVALTQTIGSDYYHFASDIGQIRNLDVQSFASGMGAKFYERLNEPFKNWLAGLNNQAKPDTETGLWKAQLRAITIQAVQDVLESSSPRDIKGITTDKGILNIFTAKNHLMHNLRIYLDPQKG